MTAAQALNSAVPSQSSARASDSRQANQDDTSFRDTLDSASRSKSANGAERDDPGAAEEAKGSKKDDADTDGEAASGREKSAGEAGNGLSQIIAALAGAARASDAASDAFAAAQSEAIAGDAQAAAQIGAEDDALLLPGQAADDEQSLDAQSLLARLKIPTTPAGTAAAETLKVHVAGQETHLALGQTSTDVLKALAEAQAQAAAEAGAQPEADVKSASAFAKAGETAADATLRTRGASQTAVVPDEPAVSLESGTSHSFRFAPVGGDARAGGLSEQGIGGQDGGQQSGGSGQSNSQQGTASFAMAINGARSAGGVERGEGSDYEPIGSQIAAGIRTEMGEATTESSPDGVVKVLHLELKPANLGSVTVRIALKDNTVSVHIEAQRRDTLASIERERDALMNALASSGYSVDSITAAHQGEASRSASGLSAFADSGGASAQGAPQGQSGQGPADGSRGDGRQDQNFRSGRDGSSGPESKDNGASGARRAADGLYV